MKVFIQNLYGIKDGRKAYYRKSDDGFDFASDPKFATELTQAEVNTILKHGEWYKNQFNAETIGAEK